MNTQERSNIFPEKLSVNDVLKLVEEKVAQCNCSLEKALELLVQERLEECN